MTVKELSQLYYLRSEVAILQEELRKVEARATALGASGLSGMPKSKKSDHGAVERYASEMADLRETIMEKKIQRESEQRRLEEWIGTISDSRLRQIFELRYISCLSWSKIAARIGGGNNEESVKKMAYRYLKREDET